MFINREDALKGLNPQQKEAVLATDGPLLILAGRAAERRGC